MWFVFPPLRALGPFFDDRLLRHQLSRRGVRLSGQPVLGPLLDFCTRTVLEIEAASVHAIFGSPDDMKFMRNAVRARGRGRATTCFSGRSITGVTTSRRANARSLSFAALDVAHNPSAVSARPIGLC
jgi:hypothetical protein